MSYSIYELRIIIDEIREMLKKHSLTFDLFNFSTREDIELNTQTDINGTKYYIHITCYKNKRQKGKYNNNIDVHMFINKRIIYFKNIDDLEKIILFLIIL